jgi:hypothetical protein
MLRPLMVLTIAALTLAVPAAGQAPAPATTAFDGTYLGVSRTLENTLDASGRPDSAKTSAPREC